MHTRLLAALMAAAIPLTVSAAWQVVAIEQGKRVEIDRESIVISPGKELTARGRIVLDKPIVDPKTSSSYRIIEVLNRFDCVDRTHATLKRSYFKEEGELLRQEEVKSPFDLPVRSGTPDDKLLREVCRPKNGSAAAAEASKTAEKVGEVAGELRKINEALVTKAVQQDLKKITTNAALRPSSKNEPPATPPRRDRSTPHNPAAHASLHWSYEGTNGPENWSKLDASYAACGNGKRQSPIDIRDGIRVDLETIQFNYRPSNFSVIDNGHTVQVSIANGSISLLGKIYHLVQIHFHLPSEEQINGKSFDMVAHMVHKSEDGKLAVIAVLLEKGAENQVIQTIWNNLPLEKNEIVESPSLTLNPGQLLPDNRSYYTYMGSLTTPPCSEGVLWLVLKQPQQISAEQLAIFARLYKNNVRPIQPAFNRIIKESR